MMRAKMVLGEMDVIIAFCTTLMNSMSEEKKEEQSEKEKMPFAGFRMKMYANEDAVPEEKDG